MPVNAASCLSLPILNKSYAHIKANIETTPDLKARLSFDYVFIMYMLCVHADRIAHCKAVGISDARKKVCNMLAADYILANTDRHLGNFGFLRDSETLEWKGLAPIYDSGTSLWQMTLTHAINAEAMVPAKPFETSRQSQLKLIAPWVDLPLERLGEDVQRCQDVGMDAHLVKPVNMEPLEKTVRKFRMGKNDTEYYRHAP